MPQLKKKYALLLGIFLFNSCGGNLPLSPKVEICALDAPNNSLECFDNQSQQGRTVSLQEANRYIMFSPDDWGLILLYVDALERRIRNRNIKRELRKIKNTSDLVKEKSFSF